MKSVTGRWILLNKKGILQLSLYQAVNSGNGGSLLLVCVTRQVRSPD